MKYATAQLCWCHLLRRLDGRVGGALKSNSYKNAARNLVIHRVLTGPRDIGYHRGTLDVATGHSFQPVFHATQFASYPRPMLFCYSQTLARSAYGIFDCALQIAKPIYRTDGRQASPVQQIYVQDNWSDSVFAIWNE